MGEMKRVLGKNWILLLLCLLFLNAFIVIKDNYTEQKTSMAFDEMVLLTNEYKTDALTYRESATRAWRQYFQNYNINSSDESDEVSAAKEARELLMAEADNADEYHNIIEKKREDALLLIRSGTYQEKSFEYLNLQKTRYDLARYENTRIGISNGIWLEQLFHYEYLQLFVLIMAIGIVYQYMAEKKSGLYFIIHTASNGRGKLFVHRCLILCGAIIITTGIFYAETAFLLLKIHGGVEGILDKAVSTELSVLTIGTLNRVGAVGLLVAVSAIAAIAISFLLWYVLSLFRNVNIGMLVFIVFVTMDYLIYLLISSKSALRGLHFINIYYLLYPNKAVLYYNWGYFFGITSLLSSTVIFAAVLSTVLGLLNYNINVRSYYNGKENIVERCIHRISDEFMRVLGRLPIVFIEIYKVLVSQKIGIVLLFLIYVITRLEVGSGVIYDAAGSYLSGYYEKADGLSYGAELESIYEEYSVEYQLFLENVNSDMESAEQVIQYRKSLLQEIRKNVAYIKQMQEKGYKVVVTKPYEYWGALGTNEEENQKVLALINIIAVIVVSSGFLSYEKKNNMLKMFRAYPNRLRWTIRKLLSNMCIIALFEAITYGIYYYKLFQNYELKACILAPVKSLPMFQNYPFDLSIGGFLIFDLSIKCLLLILISFIICHISIYIDYRYCLLVGMLTVTPQLLYLVGFEMMDKLSVGKYAAFLPLFWEGTKSIRNYYIFVAFITILGGTMFFRIICRLAKERTV